MLQNFPTGTTSPRPLACAWTETVSLSRAENNLKYKTSCWAWPCGYEDEGKTDVLSLHSKRIPIKISTYFERILKRQTNCIYSAPSFHLHIYIICLLHNWLQANSLTTAQRTHTIAQTMKASFANGRSLDNMLGRTGDITAWEWLSMLIHARQRCWW